MATSSVRNSSKAAVSPALLQHVSIWIKANSLREKRSKPYRENAGSGPGVQWSGGAVQPELLTEKALTGR